jgi:transcriptional regulator with XRE-family HTH domain
MTTHIRQIRKLRGLTLQELADKVGTTPQTIQRLETNNMTISLDWLERIGQALGLNPAMLLHSYEAPKVPLVGELGGDGSVKRIEDQKQPRTIQLSVPIEDPIALSLKDRFGPYETGTILIATRLTAPKSKSADGRDCLIELQDGRLSFRRIVYAKGGASAYVPYENASSVERNLDIAWIAPVIMAVRYMPAL